MNIEPPYDYFDFRLLKSTLILFELATLPTTKNHLVVLCSMLTADVCFSLARYDMKLSLPQTMRHERLCSGLTTTSESKTWRCNCRQPMARRLRSMLSVALWAGDWSKRQRWEDEPSRNSRRPTHRSLSCRFVSPCLLHYQQTPLSNDVIISCGEGWADDD